MNELLKIIEKRELYVHIMLFKIHIQTEGKTNNFCSFLARDIKLLFGESFSLDDYQTAQQYLISEGLTGEDGDQLTPYGRRYIEDWARNFYTLSSEEKNILQEKLPKRVFDFFGFMEKTNTVMSFLNQLLEVVKVQ